MTGNMDRRRVAEEMRARAYEGYSINLDNVASEVGIDTCDFDDTWEASEAVWNRLADLVEPEPEAFVQPEYAEWEKRRQMIHDAARECGLDGHVFDYCCERECQTAADKIARRFAGIPFQGKRSYMYCDTLDCTFFYDRKGAPSVAFSGCMRYGEGDYERAEEAVGLAKRMLGAMQRQKEAGEAHE